MVYCVAWGCKNRSTKGSGISFFRFPPEGDCRRTIWIHRCQRGEKGWTPKSASRLCSEHFEKDALARDPVQMAEMGYTNARVSLKSTAVPTMFINKEFVENCVDSTVTIRCPRSAYKKRRNAEVLSEILSENCSVAVAEDDSVDFNEVNEDHFPLLQSTSSSVGATSTMKSTSTQANLKPKQRTRRIQVCLSKPSTSIGIQCDLLVATPNIKNCNCQSTPPDSIPILEEVQDDEDEESNCDDNDEDEESNCDDQDDPEYEPSDSCDSESSDSDDDYEKNDNVRELCHDVDPANEKNFLVSESCLASLFLNCSLCLAPATAKIICQKGIMLIIQVCCTGGHDYLWHSQPQHGTMPWGHLTCAGAILFSGSSVSNILTLFHHMKVPMFSIRTYLKLQKFYVIPSVRRVWLEEQSQLLQAVQNRPLILGGDARCDSPGHTAKYGTYTLLDLELRKILDIQLVQSNEVKNSFWMELEGLKRSIRYLESNGCVISELVTDRHVSVKKYMKEENKEKKHFFDVWHMSKGIEKKLEIASKKTGCGDIHQWIKSASNHMYWVAASSGNDNAIKLDKWLSLLNHVRNQHSAHSTKFPECMHGPLEEKLWLGKGTKVFKVFEDIIGNKALLRDIPQLSPVYQTYSLEVFHSVVNRFAPKSTHFFHSAMLARMYLSALHYNENGNRPQDVTLDGELKWQICYPKAKKGQHAVAKPVKSKATYDYIDSLFRAVLQRRINLPSYALAKHDVEKLPSAPQPLTASFPTVNKKELVLTRKSRFVVRLT